MFRQQSKRLKNVDSVFPDHKNFFFSKRKEIELVNKISHFLNVGDLLLFTYFIANMSMGQLQLRIRQCVTPAVKRPTDF